MSALNYMHGYPPEPKQGYSEPTSVYSMGLTTQKGFQVFSCEYFLYS